MASGGISRTRLGEDARHEGFLRHRKFRWLKVASALSAAAAAAYAMMDVDPRPNGGSAYGYMLGTVSTLLILWLTALGIRKRAMTRGRWSLKGWTSAHVYLGLTVAVLATLHTGFQFGWNVHTLAYVLMMAVILSGVLGIAAYVTLPPRLSDSRADMTRPQMIDAVQKLDRQIELASQPLADREAALVRGALKESPFRAGLVRRVVGWSRSGRTARAIRGLRGRSADAPDSAAVEAVLPLLERKRELAGRIHRHLHIRALLELWLYVHVPLTFALLAALGAHIFSVFYYW